MGDLFFGVFPFSSICRLIDPPRELAKIETNKFPHVCGCLQKSFLTDLSLHPE